MSAVVAVGRGGANVEFDFNQRGLKLNIERHELAGFLRWLSDPNELEDDFAPIDEKMREVQFQIGEELEAENG